MWFNHARSWVWFLWGCLRICSHMLVTCRIQFSHCTLPDATNHSYYLTWSFRTQKSFNHTQSTIIYASWSLLETQRSLKERVANVCNYGCSFLINSLQMLVTFVSLLCRFPSHFLENRKQHATSTSNTFLSNYPQDVCSGKIYRSVKLSLCWLFPGNYYYYKYYIPV